MGKTSYIHVGMRINGTLICKQYGKHGIQYPHDIDVSI